MRVRPKAQASNEIRLEDDEVVVDFATSAAALADVWSSMVWLQSTSPTLNTVRREIAQWARDADEAIGEMFGHRVGSDEIRVMLEQMPAIVPRQVGPADRSWLEAAVVEARRLILDGRAAIAHVTG